jgi:hypothetical protein
VDDKSLTDVSRCQLILHGIYGLPCAHYAPDLDQVTAALQAFPRYGVPVPTVVGPGSPLFDALLAIAPARPLDVYALAAQRGLHDLAVRSSAFLLSISLANVSDAQALTMGPLYLKRLFFLHLGRADAFKRLLLVPPPDHAPTAVCGHAERAQLTRAWALASAYLAWEGRPGTSPAVPDVRPRADGTPQMCSPARSRRR